MKSQKCFMTEQTNPNEVRK